MVREEFLATGAVSCFYVSMVLYFEILVEFEAND
jgi:hypothetical protein